MDMEAAVGNIQTGTKVQRRRTCPPYSFHHLNLVHFDSEKFRVENKYSKNVIGRKGN